MSAERVTDMTIKQRRPPIKRDRSVQIDISELNLHRGEIVSREYEAAGVIQSEPTEVEDRPHLAVPIRYVTPKELERLSRFPR